MHNCLLVFFIISPSGIQLPAVINMRPLTVAFSSFLSLQLLAPRGDAIVINARHDKRTQDFPHDGKTNKQSRGEIKWLKYVQRLITDANCFRVGGERCTWGRGRGTWEYPPCAFGLRLTSELSPVSREGQHQVQLFTSAACENTLNAEDYARVRSNIAQLFLLPPPKQLFMAHFI